MLNNLRKKQMAERSFLHFMLGNDVVPSQLKGFFIPTAKIKSYNTGSSVSNNFYMKKSKLEIE